MNTKTATHTPGSWTENSDRIAGERRLVERAYLRENPVRAAAPEMLEALHALVCIADNHDFVPATDGAWKRARAAIAKAEGKATA